MKDKHERLLSGETRLVGVRYTKIVTHDIKGKRLANTAGEPFAPLEVECLKLVEVPAWN